MKLKTVLLVVAGVFLLVRMRQGGGVSGSRSGSTVQDTPRSEVPTFTGRGGGI